MRQTAFFLSVVITISGGPVVAQRGVRVEPRPRPQGERWALLVGVDKYKYIQPNLTYCGADVAALGARLVESGFGRNHVVVLHDMAEPTLCPTKANIERQLRLTLESVGPGDFLFLAFSGHGVRLDDKSYLCPYDAKLDPADLLAVDGIYGQLQKCRAKLKLFFIDACQDEKRVPKEFVSTRSTGQIKSLGIGQEETLPAGIFLLTSCSPGQESVEEPDFGHGVFTHFLLEGLDGHADADDSGSISLLEWASYASSKTRAYVRTLDRAQSPAIRGEVPDFDLVEVPKRNATVYKAWPFDATEAKQRQKDTAKSLGLPAEITNSIGMKLKLIPAGEFEIGSPQSEADRDGDEGPQHKVRITKPFYLGAYEVTLGQFRRFVQASGYKTEAETNEKGGYGWSETGGKLGQKEQYTWQNTGFRQNNEHPVVNVSWNDAVAFCKWLSEKEGKSYRLPTEAQWEYACRAGTATKWYCGDAANDLVEIGNVADATARTVFPDWTVITARDGYVFTASVGSFRPNAWELHDMHGNVWEWCQDLYSEHYDANQLIVDPGGPASGSSRVFRGGSWYSGAWGCRSALRNRGEAESCEAYLGFRVLRAVSRDDK